MERKPQLQIEAAPFVGAFMYLLHGVLEIYLRDPFLKLIGVMG